MRRHALILLALGLATPSAAYEDADGDSGSSESMLDQPPVVKTVTIIKKTDGLDVGLTVGNTEELTIEARAGVGKGKARRGNSS